MAAKKTTKENFPKTIYADLTSDNTFNSATEDLEQLSAYAENGESIGVYELVAVKTLKINGVTLV